MAKPSISPLRRRKTATNLFRSTMNRFLRKKAPEALSSNDDALSALSGPSPPPPASPGIKKSGTSRWKRGKKPVEVKPQLNLPFALPTTDDFRTSLLMPNLSARFSMLREQDDPNSLLGKASDDSVLQPRRRSRMDFGGLGDIAEVSSIKSAGRPRAPFAFERQDSFASEDGYASENDSSQSMMSRARPGEGNVLFGGRQKVYMIPKAGASSTKSLGRVVYEDDLGKSAFQKYKREKELQEGRVSDESQGFDFGLDQAGHGAEDDVHAPTPNDSAKDLSHSPSLSSYERKRSTGSTSHSEARSSTAATSVASQAVTSAPSPAFAPIQPVAPPASVPSTLKRADTKTRRLYEQGLDQHMYDQQTSALTRLNSIQRQRTLNGGKQQPPALQSTKSASNLQDRARQPVYALRAQSPEAASPLLTTFGSIRNPPSNGTSPIPSIPQSPTSPHGLEFDTSALTQALDPSDRGKATAMGAFSKPKQSFDEDQYLERQRQLQRSTSSAAIKKNPSVPSAFRQRMDRLDQERERSHSSASNRSRSRSIPKQQEPPSAPNPYNVFQRAAQMNTQNGGQQFDKSNLPDTHRTFFGNISASDSEDEEEEQPQAQPQTRHYREPWSPDFGYGTQHGRWQPTALPSVLEHPALRGKKSKASLAEEDEDMEPMPLRPAPSSLSLQQDSSIENKAEEDYDSPTLGPGVGSTTLNGLMHHLRQQSNQSSIFPHDDKPASMNDAPEMPDWNPRNLDLTNLPVRSTVDSDSRVGSTYTSSNPWDLDEADNTTRGDRSVSRGSISPIEGPRPSTQLESRAPSQMTFLNRQSDVSELGPEREPEIENETSWQHELQKHHTRDASTATQQEREGFANELAARRNAIQENIKSMVERDTNSRGNSPAPSVGGARKAFGMLRSGPSRESSIDSGPRPAPAHAPPKAMKMLGISGGGANSSSNTLNSQYERGGYSLDVARPRDQSTTRPNAGRPLGESVGRSPNLSRPRDNSGSRPPVPNNPTRALQRGESDARRETDQSRSRSRENSETNRPDRMPQTGRSPAPSLGGRSRANSEVTTGRARSRTGPYRDDLEKAMVEGTGSSASVVPELSPMIPRELTPRPSPEMAQNHFEPARERSNSRAGIPDYFNHTNLHPIQTGLKDRLTSAGPSPITLSPNVYTPSINSTRSPISPFAQNMTPPLSGANTPLSSNFSAPPQIPPSSGRPNGVLRKKTISKGDISEPTLVSFTSNIDVVDLPEGASLKNGMDEPPPLPPMNPKRRATKAIFAFGRKESGESVLSYGDRSKTPDPWLSRATTEPDMSWEHTRGIRSASGNSPRKAGTTTKQSFDQSPAMRQYAFAPNGGSPERELERLQRSPVPPYSVAMEGGMF